MYIALMPDVKDHAVVRQVKDAVHGDRNFDSAEVGGEMPAGFRDGLHQETSNLLVGQRFQLRVGMDFVENRILVFFHGVRPLSNCTVLTPKILHIGQCVEISFFAHIFARGFSTFKMCKM